MWNYSRTSFRYRYAIHQMTAEIMRLMKQVLTPMEVQIITLHCGFSPQKDIVGFSQLAARFSLASGMAAKTLYYEAIIKIRKAIPDSSFERWVLLDADGFCLERYGILTIDPYAPIKDWTKESDTHESGIYETTCCS